MTVSGAELVKFPEGAAAWTVQVSGSVAGIKTVEVAQDDGKQRTVVTFTNGAQSETWKIPGSPWVLTESPAGKAYLSSSAGLAILPFDAHAFQWLKPELLREPKPVRYKDKNCYHYRGAAPAANELGEVYGTVEKEAWIDSDTLHPVALRDGAMLGVFTFQKTPPEPLTPSGKFANLFKLYEARQKSR